MSCDLVIPTTGRPALLRLLRSLACEPPAALPDRVIVVHDASSKLDIPPLDELRAALGPRLAVLRSHGRGPAAARNRGWLASQAAWVAFLDDDVIPAPGWAAALREDLAGAGEEVGGSQGRVVVPLPAERPPSDWERNVAGLETAVWATADMAYRRSALLAVGGFDERFRRAYREDSDLALRVRGRGWEIASGRRTVSHPPGRARPNASVALQRGNRDDALMRRLHGRGWRERARAPRGRLAGHCVIVAAALAAALLLPRRPRAAMVAGGLAVGGVGELAWRRIAPGPRDGTEIARMLLTSAVIPFAAVAHRVLGELRWRSARPWRPAPAAVLFDRDGTLIRDVPYNGDPRHVVPMPGARAALDVLRAAGVPIGVISNQSGIARGLIDERQLHAVNRRVEELLGPIAIWLHCPHGPGDGCGCRKPAPGMVLEAARRLGVEASACAVVGDIGADVEAAAAAGARGVLVPTPRTRRRERARAGEKAGDLLAAVRTLIGEAA